MLATLFQLSGFQVVPLEETLFTSMLHGSEVHEKIQRAQALGTWLGVSDAVNPGNETAAPPLIHIMTSSTT